MSCEKSKYLTNQTEYYSTEIRLNEMGLLASAVECRSYAVQF